MHCIHCLQLFLDRGWGHWSQSYPICVWIIGIVLFTKPLSWRKCCSVRWLCLSVCRCGLDRRTECCICMTLRATDYSANWKLILTLFDHSAQSTLSVSSLEQAALMARSLSGRCKTCCCYISASVQTALIHFGTNYRIDWVMYASAVAHERTASTHLPRVGSLTSLGIDTT